MMNPEDVLKIDEEYAERHAENVAIGKRTAAELSVCVIGIARNAMPYMANTLSLVERLQPQFRDFQMYVYENDSTDGTNLALDDFAAGHPWLHVRHDTLGGIDSRGFEPERTARLAKCRNECHDYVRRHAARDYLTIVLDMDPQGGFSVDGVFSSIYWLTAIQSAGCVASYSIWSAVDDGVRKVAHYDAWAARPVCWWRDRREEIGFAWFSMFLPPVGSWPMQMNSAFGGLAVYRTEAFLAAGANPYEGGDCEHVILHRKMAAAGWKLFLNPGCVYVSMWPTG